MELSIGKEKMKMDENGLAILESLSGGRFSVMEDRNGFSVAEDRSVYRYACYQQSVAKVTHGTRISRLFMGLDENNEEHKRYRVDHINRDTLDNRLVNLRVVDGRTNVLNCKLNRNNKSGMSGVWYDQKKRRYVVSVYEVAYKEKRENFAFGPLSQWKTQEEAREAAFACRREWDLRNGCTNGQEPVQT